MRFCAAWLSFVVGISLSSAAACQDEPVKAWIAENAVTLQTVEPGSDLGDRDAFGEMVGEANIVGLGEPTHGNREIYRLKHRLFEYLVREKGFTHLGIELPFAETAYLNDYVLHGTGTAEEALSYTTMWASDVAEVAEMLDWMRDWNLHQPSDRRLQVFGFDMQSPERAAREVLASLDRLNPELASSARRDLGSLAIPILDSDALGYRPILASEADDDALASARAIVAFFGSDEALPGPSVDQMQKARLRQLARNLLWWVEANHGDGGEYSRIRDFAQAENVDWALSQAGNGAKAALWAHNVHVANLNTERLDGVDMAGRHLKRRHGQDYVIVGTFYANGQITALEATPRGHVRSFDTGRAQADYLEAQFPPGMAFGLLNLKDVPRSGPVRDWFDRPQRTRHSGGGYLDDGYAYATFDYLLPEAFDIVALVRDTTATRPISPQDTVGFRPLQNAANLGFEQISEGLPQDWAVWSKQARWGYSVATVGENAPEGKHYAKLCRRPESLGAEGVGSLVQYVDATKYWDTHISVSALTSGELADDAIAFLRVKIEPDPEGGAHTEDETAVDTLDRYRIGHRDWERETVTVSVPRNAGYIMFGVQLVGEGCVSIDDVTIETGP